MSTKKKLTKKRTPIVAAVRRSADKSLSSGIDELQLQIIEEAITILRQHGKDNSVFRDQKDCIDRALRTIHNRHFA